ncbi:MAG: prepilin-type N-terminal cleavage/methylation domain-containing protein [Chthoniobacterales bacterium]|nr:prepilin-type N-terminal cleavage/methylation domain-containing protein [Chthoniobacterales bacterium]
MFSLSRPRTAVLLLGFTLLELLIVVAIVGILATLLIPVYGKLRERAQKVQCIANLHNLYVAADVYVQQQRHWPQIFLKNYETIDDHANAWINALAPYGPTRKTWICPTIQDLLQDPDYTQPHQARLDYVSAGFDDKQTSPHQWPTQPWFIEAGNVHGNGNLVILTDGSVAETNDLLPK